MKNSWKFIYLFVLFVMVESLFMIVSGVKKEIPNNIHDRTGLVISDFQNCTFNNLDYNDGKFIIKGEDPYIVISNINKFIDSMDIMVVSQENTIRWCIYYDIGKGFNQKDIIGAEKKNDELYRSYLKGNILNLRLDIEGASEGEIEIKQVILHNGFARFKKRMIYAFILSIFCFVLTMYGTIIGKHSLSISAVKVFISAFFIGMSVRAILRASILVAIFISLMDLMVILTCFFWENFDKKKIDDIIGDYDEKDR